VRGAVLLLSILDHDKIGADDFAGEVAVHLSTIAPMEMSSTVDSKPAIMIPIRRPTSQKKGPYKVMPTYSLVRVHVAFQSKRF
jgi:hypothetical protein